MANDDLYVLYEKIVNSKARDNSLTPEELQKFDKIYEEATSPYNKMPVKETKKIKEEVEPAYTSFTGTPILTEDPGPSWLPTNYRTHRSPAPERDNSPESDRDRSPPSTRHRHRSDEVDTIVGHIRSSISRSLSKERESPQNRDSLFGQAVNWTDRVYSGILKSKEKD